MKQSTIHAGSSLVLLFLTTAAPRTVLADQHPRSPVDLTAPATPDGNTLIRVSIASDLRSISPGSSGFIAVTYTIERNWYTYWRNAGDTGGPPDFIFEKPEWLQIDDALWPVPERYELPGDILDYVYRGTATFLFPFTVASDAPITGEHPITLRTSWLVCRDLCLPGRAEATLTLTAARVPVPSTSADRIRALYEALPKPFSIATAPKVSLSWVGLSLHVHAPGADEIAFFPDERTGAMPLDPLRNALVKGDRLVLPFSHGKDGSSEVSGLIRIRRGDSAEYHVITSDLAAGT